MGFKLSLIDRQTCGRRLRHRHVQALHAAIAQHVDSRVCSRVRSVRELSQLLCVPYTATGKPDDDVAGFESGSFCRRSCADPRDERSTFPAWPQARHNVKRPAPKARYRCGETRRAS
jgi:hypothetical protein